MKVKLLNKIWIVFVFLSVPLLGTQAQTPYSQKSESDVILLPERADSIAFETLVGISSYGWDPIYKGILINWRRDNPDRINNTSGGDFDIRDTQTRHDTQNDIRALQHYYWFKRLHEKNDFFDEAINRLEPTVREKFKKMSSKKGWMYYVLLRLWEYGGDKAFWKNSIMQWGSNVYSEIDHDLGVYYETNMANCDCGTSTIYLDKAYRVDHQVEAGAAMVDAGTRFNKPEWVTAGYRQVMTAYEQSFSEKYGLFGRIHLFGTSGYKKDATGAITNNYDYSAFQNKLWDGQCKLGEASEEVDALLRAAYITTNPEIRAKFLEISEKMLDALSREAIHDKTYGGFYQMMYVADSGDGRKAGYVVTDKKEMRQASLLGTYYLANQIIGNKWQAMQDEMLKLLVTEITKPLGKRGMYMPDTGMFSDQIVNGYRGSVAGYTFELNPDWSIYQHKTVDENWVSNESNSLILLGLYQYLTPINDFSDPEPETEASKYLLFDEDFTTWTKQGAVLDHTLYSQSVSYMPSAFQGTFKYTCSAVDPKANTACDKKGQITINPAHKADGGWLVLPELPSVGLIKIFRQGKAGAHMRLDKWKDGVEFTDENMVNNANWEEIDIDDSEVTLSSACIEYVFPFRSETPVQLRITTTGNSSNNLTRLYVERYPQDGVGINAVATTKQIPVYVQGNELIANEDITKMEIFDITGIKVKTSIEQVTSISDLNRGIYIVKYISKTGQSGSLKIIR